MSRNDGSHVFAATLAEHNHNVFTYQVQPFRQKRLQERRQQIEAEKNKATVGKKIRKRRAAGVSF